MEKAHAAAGKRHGLDFLYEAMIAESREPGCCPRVRGDVVNTVQRGTSSERRQLMNKSVKSEIPGGENVKPQ